MKNETNVPAGSRLSRELKLAKRFGHAVRLKQGGCGFRLSIKRNGRRIDEVRVYGPRGGYCYSIYN